MKRGKFQPGLFRYIFDASSLINIKNNNGMKKLRSRKSDILIPEKVGDELTCPGVRRSDPLFVFVSNYPEIITQFETNEEIEYLKIRSQTGIHDGEAAAIAIASNRQLPLIIDDNRGIQKAANHNVNIFSSNDFLSQL